LPEPTLTLWKLRQFCTSIQNAQKTVQNIAFPLVHTGQHYDVKMSNTYFNELNIPHPDVNLEYGGGSQAEQTTSILIAFEKDLLANPADLVLVVGDVTSAMACAIVAKILNIKVAHV
jgi:UDP-N-acetylglucosamine 2-epimerase (non-hydrolysing)